MTIDGGTTWTTKTLTTSYQLFSETKTAANPQVGFRIVTSGDAVDVDFNMLETSAIVTSPVVTTTATVTRNADVITVATSKFNGLGSIGTTGTIFLSATPNAVANVATAFVVSITDASTNNSIGIRRGSGDPTQLVNLATVAASGQTAVSSLASAITNGTLFTAGASWVAGANAISVNHAATVTAAPTSAPTGLTTIGIGLDGGSSNHFNGYIQRIAVFPVKYANAIIQNGP